MDFLHIVDQINVLIEHSASQWWVIPIVSLFCLIDGFFLFLPSETAIVALASISARTGQPNIWLLIIGASMGAMIGDNIAYLLGRTLGTTRFKWMRKPRGAKAFAWAGRELEKRGAILIFTARYIPVGRIAVNFTAGATYFPWRRFVVLDSIAVVTWACYSVAVGTFAGRWVHDNPLLGVGIAIVFAIAIGFLVDHAIKYLHHFLEKRGRVAPRPEPGLMAAQHAARVHAEAAQRTARAQLDAENAPVLVDATQDATQDPTQDATQDAAKDSDTPGQTNSCSSPAGRDSAGGDSVTGANRPSADAQTGAKTAPVANGTKAGGGGAGVEHSLATPANPATEPHKHLAGQCRIPSTAHAGDSTGQSL